MSGIHRSRRDNRVLSRKLMGRRHVEPCLVPEKGNPQQRRMESENSDKNDREDLQPVDRKTRARFIMPFQEVTSGSYREKQMR